MALTDFKITETNVAEKGLAAAPDQLTGTPQENKAVFDRLIREVVKADHNDLIDALVALGVQQLIQYGSDEVKYIRSGGEGRLEISKDGETWRAIDSLATQEAVGLVKPGDWLRVQEDGTLDVQLSPATGNTAGVIKVGTDFDVTEDGTLSLYKSIAVESLTSSLSYTYEMGQTAGTTLITPWRISWVLNKAAATQTVTWTLADGSVETQEVNGLTYAERYGGLGDGTSGNHVTAKIAVTDARGAAASRTTWVDWYNGVYYGAAADGDVDSAFIQGLKKSLQANRTKTFTDTAGEGQHLWYACPTSYGTPVFKVGGFDGGFSKAATLNYTNVHGYTTTYQVWRSDNAGLGGTTVQVS